MLRYVYALAALLCCLVACGTEDPVDAWPELNLLQYEVPVTVHAPAGTTVKNKNLGILQDVTLNGPEGYDVQLYVSESLGTPAVTVLADQREEVEAMRYFATVIEEQPDAFLFRMVVDTSNISYDFRHVRVIGDKELVFQTGLSSHATEDEARRMMEAVRK